MIYTLAGDPVEVEAAERRTVTSLVTGKPVPNVWHAQVRYLSGALQGQLAYSGGFMDAGCSLRGDGGRSEVVAACEAVQHRTTVMAEHGQQFETFQQWVNKASSWLTGHPDYSASAEGPFRAICFDSWGRLCRIGADFARARDEGAFPVRWLWPDQVGPLVIKNAAANASGK